jgi:hypothetical protein
LLKSQFRYDEGVRGKQDVNILKGEVDPVRSLPPWGRLQEITKLLLVCNRLQEAFRIGPGLPKSAQKLALVLNWNAQALLLEALG